MSSSPLTRRAGVTVLTAGLLSTGALAVLPTPAVAAGPTTGVTVYLKAPDLPALDRLASARGLSHAQRVAAVSKLVPSASSVSTVASFLTHAGFTGITETAWSVSAAAPKSTVTSVFGAVADLRSGLLRTVPSSLSDLVAGTETTSNVKPFHAMAAEPLNGTDFRNAYATPKVTPPDGTDDSGATVATLQLSNWDDSDLTNYAKEQKPALPDPVASKQYKAVNVSDGKTTGTTDTSGDVEVDLDQESILSTAPSANQRAYFAPNTDAGFRNVFSSVFDDVTQDSHATGGGDSHITALSSSWGGCESQTGAKSIALTEPILKSLVAAGVTVFASSGDDGIYDCRDTTMTGEGNHQSDVDYPASSPEVVGVGGTNLQSTTTPSTANTGSNFTETTWTCTGAITCQSSIPELLPPVPGGTGGSGGGESGSAGATSSTAFGGFDAPAYQSRTITTKPFKGVKKRLVPDIAADGDPNTGFTLYTSDATVAPPAGGDAQVGGTSLASPISAALLTNTLSAHKVTTGVGDIHAALYSAYAAKAGAFRDVTTGSNGDYVDKGADPSVKAQAGYDTTTGLGGVLWPSLAPYLLNTTTPTAANTIALTSPYSTSTPDAVKATWSAGQGSDKILADRTTVTITKLGTTTPVYSATSAPLSGSTTFTGTPGATYQIRSSVTDLAGNTSAVTKHALLVPIDDKAFTFHGSWTRKTGSHDLSGSRDVTSTKGATATVKATGQIYQVRVATGPGLGKLSVSLGSTKLGTIDLYSASAGHKTVTIYDKGTSARASRTFTFGFTGTKRSAATSDAVDLDGLFVAY